MSPPDLKALRQQLVARRSKLRQEYEAQPDPDRFLCQWTRSVDEALIQLWQESGLDNRISLGAVGGYGRGELYPWSDVDILVLLPEAPDSTLQTQVESFIGLLWDIGLEMGHGVRTLEECFTAAREDLTIASNLSDVRYLAGDPAAIETLQTQLGDRLDRVQFVLGKIQEQRARHMRHNDTAFNLEPNLKEGPGGLRDLQSVMWISWGCGLKHGWAPLVNEQMITRSEVRQAKLLIRFLQDLRIRLHFLANRREDRLLFDHQGPLAQQLGIDDQDQLHRASEILMQQYFKMAKSVLLLNTILLVQLRTRIQPEDPSDIEELNSHYRRYGQLLGTVPEDLLQREPQRLFEAFLMLQHYPNLKGFTASALRAVWRARHHINAEFRANPENQSRFLEIFRQPHRTADVLRRMNYYDVLGRYLPAFAKIVGQMQHDLFHVYTVDEHILKVLRNLRRLSLPQFEHEFPFCSQLMRQFDRPDLLYLGALFHDIAKGRGGDHSQLGGHDAREFCRSHGLARADTEFVAWLVENHLHMSAVAQKQDLSNPEVIKRFAERAGDTRHLTALYLLTVSDIRGTSPKVWNAWKGKLLEDLYRATLNHLAGHATEADDLIREKRQGALHILKHYGIQEAGQIPLWRALDDSYFLRHDVRDITWHARALINQKTLKATVVRARLSPLGEGMEVMVYTPDQKALFARLCGYFDGVGYTIQEARIHTTTDGYALDTFQIVHRTSDGDHYREVQKRIEAELSAQLESQSALPTPQKVRISRHLRHFPIPVRVDIGEPEQQDIRPLGVVAGDRPGLLYRIARVLLELEIDLRGARINTLGERAEDVFLVAGKTLENAEGREQLSQKIIQALES
jgi:[protein-PII] uridylyltransferase